MSRIGEKIKNIRMEKKMSVKQFAKKCGVSESYMADIECGKKIINDSMIKKVSKVLGVNLDEPLYIIEDEPIQEPEVKREEKRGVSVEWQSAFSNIIKDIPIYQMDMENIIGYKKLPIIDKKVEGHNPEKLIYIMLPDNTLSGFRLRKGDKVMVVLNNEMLGGGLCAVEYDGKKAVRQIKRLDGDKILLISHSGDINTQTKSIKEVKIIGHCIKAEINLENI